VDGKARIAFAAGFERLRCQLEHGDIETGGFLVGQTGSDRTRGSGWILVETMVVRKLLSLFHPIGSAVFIRSSARWLC
jgi:hypothetical protein